MDNNFKIGDPVYVNTAGLEKSLKQLNELLPLINNLADYISELKLPHLTSAEFNMLLQTGPDTLLTHYRAIITEDLKNVGSASPIFKSLTDSAILETQRKFEILIKAINSKICDIHTRTTSEPLNKPITEIQFKAGRPFIDNNKIKDRYTTKIENKGQIRVLQLMSNVKESWDEVAQIAEDNGYRVKEWPLMGDGRFFEEDSNCRLIIDPTCIFHIKC